MLYVFIKFNFPKIYEEKINLNSFYIISLFYYEK